MQKWLGRKEESGHDVGYLVSDCFVVVQLIWLAYEGWYVCTG